MLAVLFGAVPDHRQALSSRPARPQRALRSTALAAVLAGRYWCHG
jgi:hypothetical protein